MDVHPLAIVHPSARLGCGVSVGPFCVVEADVQIGDGCQLASGVMVKSGTTLGRDNRVFEHAVLGGLPQHVHMPDRPGRLVIGRGNTIRENVTMHRALAHDAATTIGDENLIMVGVHVAHDCRIGNHVILANNVMLAGHVSIDDRAYISGAVGVHQFCRIGALAMVGGQAHVVKDVPPFVTVDGVSTTVVGLNRVGLKRAGITPDEMLQLKAAYRLIYRSGLPWSAALEQLNEQFSTGPTAALAEFFAGGARGFTPARSAPHGATLVLRTDAEEPPQLQVKAG